MVEATGFEPVTQRCKRRIFPTKTMPPYAVCFHHNHTIAIPYMVETSGIEPEPEPCEGSMLPLSLCPPLTMARSTGHVPVFFYIFTVV